MVEASLVEASLVEASLVEASFPTQVPPWEMEEEDEVADLKKEAYPYPCQMDQGEGTDQQGEGTDQQGEGTGQR